MRRWARATGLVGLAITGCATSDDSNFTASLTSQVGTGQPGGEDDPSGSTGGDSLDDGATSVDDGGETGGDPTVGPIDTGDEGGQDPPPAGSDCCAAQAQPGCGDAMIEACVCAQDPFCCEQAWNADCVESVAALDCGQCGNVPPPDPADDGGGPMGGGACCMPQAMPGCADAMVEACVCEADAFCCEQAWNEECVFLVDELGCGDCGGAMPPPDPSGGGGSCCMATGGPGCGDPAVEECICGLFADAYCCEVEWDEQCADEVGIFGCGAC